MRVIIRMPDLRAPGMPRMVALSLLGHSFFVAMAVFLPGILPRSAPPRWDKVMVGSLVELPAAPPGRAAAQAATTNTAPPAERPAPVAARPQPAPKARREPPPPPKKEQTKTATPRKEPAPEPSEQPAEQRAAAQPDSESTESTPAGNSEPRTGAGTSAPAQEIGLTVGGGNAFAGAYAYYLASTRNKLQANYMEPLHPGEAIGVLSVRVSFTLARNGTVHDVRVDIPSPYPPLDDAALRAVYRAAPFPPLPATYTQDALPVGVTFTLHPAGL